MKIKNLYYLFFAIAWVIPGGVHAQTNWSKRLLLMNQADSIMDAYSFLSDLSYEESVYSDEKAAQFKTLFYANAKIFNEVCPEVLRKNGNEKMPFKIGYAASLDTYLREIKEMHKAGLPNYKVTFYNFDVSDIDASRIQVKVVRAGVLATKRGGTDTDIELELTDTLNIYLSARVTNVLKIDSIVPVGIKMIAGKGYELKDSGRKVIEDFDGDGVLNEFDLCKYQWSTDPAGCPVVDLDGDGVPNTLDYCPYLAGSANSGGCPDADHDLVPNILDPESFPLRNGLTLILRDREKNKEIFIQVADMCPDEMGSIGAKGCPDNDGDGIPDIEDDCKCQEGYVEIAGRYGCPSDTDGDGIFDPKEHSEAYIYKGFYALDGKGIPKRMIGFTATGAMGSADIEHLSAGEWAYENLIGNIQFPATAKSRSLSFDARVGSRLLSGEDSDVDKKLIFQVGVGLNGTLKTVTPEYFATTWDYQSTDLAGNPFRQRATLKNQSEKLSMLGFALPLSMKIGINPYGRYKEVVNDTCLGTIERREFNSVHIKRKIAPFLEFAIGPAFYLSNRASGTATVDLEAIYFYENGQYAFPQEIKPERGYRFITTSPLQGQDYFDKMQAAGFNVGLSMPASAKDDLSVSAGYFGQVVLGTDIFLSLKSSISLGGMVNYSSNGFNPSGNFQPVDLASSTSYQSLASGIKGVNALNFGLQLSFNYFL